MKRNMTAENWNQAPYNRYSFQRVQDFFPTTRLSRGDQTAFNFGTRETGVGHITYKTVNGEQSTIDEMVSESFTDAFLVVQAGDILHEQYLNGMNANSLHLINSITKSFVGMLTGIVVEKGLVTPENLIVDYLPELNTDAWEGATVRHLLDMTAGVHYHEEYENLQTDFWREAAVVGWRPDLVNKQTPDGLLAYARHLTGMDQKNGEKFHYRTVTTNVLGLMIERIMDEPLEDIITREIWAKLGANNDANVVVDRHGSLYAGAGMSACARDLACFGMLMSAGGRLQGQQIVPEAWITDTLAGAATSRQCYLDSEYAEFGFSHYRNQVWVKDAEKKIMLALGIHGQIIYMHQDNDLVIVKLSSQKEQVNAELFVNAFNAMDSIAETLSL